MGTVYRRAGGTDAAPVLKQIGPPNLPRPPGPIGPPLTRSIAAHPRHWIARMIRRHKWMHARGFAFAGAIDATSGRYVPDASEILTAAPRPGTFYRSRPGITPSHVAAAAYGSKNIKMGLMLMNRSTWNDHIRRAKTSWTAYGVEGLQFDPRYGSHPLSKFGTGSLFPVVWLPPLDGLEPEAVIVSPVPPTFKPGEGGIPKPPPLPPIGPGGLPPPWVQPTPPSGPTPTPPSGPGYVSGRYVPSAGQILIKAPRPGTFYRPRPGITPSHVAAAAYGSKNIKAGLMLMNRSTWNDHIRRAKEEWTSYGVEGLQFDPRYGSHPLSTFGTGSLFPVTWLPPLDGREPEAFYAAPGPTPPPYVPPTPPPYVPPTPPGPPPYVPPTPPGPPPYVPPTPPEPPPGPPEPPPYVPPTPPEPPPYVPPGPPPEPPPYVPPGPPPEPPPYVPPTPPSEKKDQLGGVLAGVTLIAALARFFER